MLSSLTMSSELLTLSGISQLTQHDGYCVQATPTEPNYWMSNQLILQHRSFVWDIPNMPQDVIPAAFVENGFKHDDVDALVPGGTLRQVDVPDGIQIRPIQSDGDWAAAMGFAALCCATPHYGRWGVRRMQKS